MNLIDREYQTVLDRARAESRYLKGTGAGDQQAWERVVEAADELRDEDADDWQVISLLAGGLIAITLVGHTTATELAEQFVNAESAWWVLCGECEAEYGPFDIAPAHDHPVSAPHVDHDGFAVNCGTEYNLERWVRIGVW